MRLLCACLSLMALHVFADVTWASEVELGAVFTGGNTEQETLKFRFDTRRDSEKHVNTFHADLFNAAEDGNSTAEKNYLFYRLGKKLGDDRDSSRDLVTRETALADLIPRLISPQVIT